MSRSGCALVLVLSACAQGAPIAACTTCAPDDDGVEALFADPRVTSARARRSPYVLEAEAARRARDAAEGEARDDEARIARTLLLAAIVEQTRLDEAPRVEPLGVIAVDPEARLAAAREDAAAIALRTLTEATTDEERRLAATARDRRAQRVQAAAELATACEDAIASAAASMATERIAEFRSRLSAALAERDVDARYVALDALATDLREALRSLVP